MNEETLTSKLEALPDDKSRIEYLVDQVQQIKRAQAGSDRAYKEARDKLSQTADMATVQARIDAIEKAYQHKARQLEVSFYTRSKCLELGVDYALLEGLPFSDEIQVDSYLKKIDLVLKDKAMDEIQQKLLSAEKPKGGQIVEKRAPMSFQELEKQFRM